MKKLLTILLASATLVAHAQLKVKGTVWDTKGIRNVPQYKVMTSDSAIGLIYQGLSYQGKPQNVYAYYATPGTLNGDRNLDKNLPAVVLVHGGGGTAFREWAVMWAKKGYAAIAMDLRGNGPGKKHIDGGFNEPNGETPYFTITPDLSGQWMFQAVADVILANNLLRSFPEVDTTRTAITGISWGGIITCLMAGIDQRYQVAVPVYGCGYLLQNSSMRQGLLNLNAPDRLTWVKQYDPMNYISQTHLPMLFLNGANDPHFYLDSYAKTYRQVKDHNLCIKPGLKHSHHHGWANDEIFAFINCYLNKGTPMAHIADPISRASGVTAAVKYSIPISRAQLNYTTDTTNILMNRKWQSAPADFDGQHISVAQVPAGTTIWYLSVTDQQGLMVSGSLQFINPKL